MAANIGGRRGRRRRTDSRERGSSREPRGDRQSFRRNWDDAKSIGDLIRNENLKIHVSYFPDGAVDIRQWKTPSYPDAYKGPTKKGILLSHTEFVSVVRMIVNEDAKFLEEVSK